MKCDNCNGRVTRATEHVLEVPTGNMEWDEYSLCSLMCVSALSDKLHKANNEKILSVLEKK